MGAGGGCTQVRCATMAAMAKQRVHIDDEERERIREAFNARISRLCIALALIICVLALGVWILGSQDPRYVVLGIIVAIILLAIAQLQDHPKR